MYDTCIKTSNSATCCNLNILSSLTSFSKERQRYVLGRLMQDTVIMEMHLFSISRTFNGYGYQMDLTVPLPTK